MEDNSTNWREDRFDANLNGVENLYRKYPKVQGTNARYPPIVRTKSVQSINGTDALFSGKVVSNGNNKNLTIGFQFSENIKFENSTEIILETKPFEISYNFSIMDRSFFIIELSPKMINSNLSGQEKE